MKNFSFKGFKKVHQDEHHITLKHPEGHEIKVAMKPLSPKMRSEMHKLPVMKAKGGEIDEPIKSMDIDHREEGEELPKRSKETDDSSPEAKAVQTYDEGGEVSPQPSPSAPVDPDKWKAFQEGLNKRINKAKGGPIRMYAEGTDDVQPMQVEPMDQNDPQQPSQQAPVTINIHGGQRPEANQSAQPILAKPTEPVSPQDSGKQLPTQLPVDQEQADKMQQQAQMAPAMAAPNQQPAAQPTIAPPPVDAAQNMENQIGLPQTQQMMQDAYVMGHQGITKQSEAEQEQSEGQVQALQGKIAAEKQLMAGYLKHSGDIRAELENVRHDYEKGHIDPNAYWDNHSKLLTGIGFILAGFNPAGRPNAAMDYVNRRIEDSISAQKANMDKKSNLMSALMHQFNNEGQATDMARLILADQAQAEMQKAAAKSGSKMAEAKALQLKSQLMQQYAPIFQNLALTQARISMSQGQPGQGGQQGSDPSSLVPVLVPKEHQESVYKEIERAQDTRRMGDAIMKSFDQAAKDVRPLSGGRLKNILPGTESAYVGSLHQAMQPTFKDLEGTVRQAAMDNTFANITPHMGNSDLEIKTKRQALADYLKSKASAPRAKSFGIDLGKYENTKPSTGEPKLNSQQQSFLKWAQANPGNPKAKMVLKQLGMEE